MAFNLKGVEFLSDNRELIGINTVGINTTLFVGENIEVNSGAISISGSGITAVGAGKSFTVTELYVSDGSTTVGVATISGSNFSAEDITATNSLVVEGNATVRGILDFGSDFSAGFRGIDLSHDGTLNRSLTMQTTGANSQQIQSIGVSTDLAQGGSASNNTLPTELAVKDYVDGAISGVSQANFLSFQADGAGDTGRVDLGSSETLEFFSDANIDLLVDAADGNRITFSLASDITANVTGDLTGNADSATSASAVDGNVVTSDFQLGGASALTGVSTNIAVSPTDAQIPTALAVSNAINAASTPSDITVNADDDTASDFLLPFTQLTSGQTGATELRTDSSNNEQLTYNPGSGTLKAKIFDALSDARLKTNIETIEGATEKVAQLRGVEYNWKNGSGASVGVIAQEVQAVYPQLVTETEERMTVNYNGLVGLLLQAVNELSAEVEALKAAK